MADRGSDDPDREDGAAARIPAAVVEGYELLGVLGRGSVGVVYKARHLALNRLVALKMVMAGAHVGREQLARFTTEARAVAALKHPAIVQIHEIGESGGLPFLSLEYVDGPSLDRTLGGRPQDPRAAVRLIATIADAVHLAHCHGILHRDIKPANILLPAGGTPKLTDFGLAKDLHDHSSQTCAGTLLGTPCYMAPEQANGDPAELGPAVDIHALGAILYEMLVGRPPFLGASPYETTVQVVHDEPVRPSRLVGRLPEDVETICLKCLQKDPAKRFRDADALAEDCRRFLRDEPIVSRPVSARERAWRWCRRNPRFATLAASVAGLLVLLAVGSTTAAILLDARRQDADKARQQAVAALDLAERRKRDSEKAFADAERQRLAAEAAKKQAQESAKVASDQTENAVAMAQLLVDKVQRQLRDAPGTRGLKAELLQTALDGLEKIARVASGDGVAAPVAGLDNAEKLALAARMRRAAIYREIGDSGKAAEEYVICETIARRRVANQPDNPAAKGNLAVVLVSVGDLLVDFQRDMPAARARFEEALRIWRALDSVSQEAMAKATTSANVAEACTSLAVTCARLGDTAAAGTLFEEALDRRRQLARDFPENLELATDAARSVIPMAERAFRDGDTALARRRYAECIDAFESIVAAASDDPRVRFELANALGNYGEFCVRSGSLEEARGLVERSLTIHREIAALDPDDVDLRRCVGVDLYRLAVIDDIAGLSPGDSGRIDECQGIRKGIAEQDPANALHRIDWMLALARSGDHPAAAAMAEAFGDGRADTEIHLNVARCFAQCAVATRDMASELSARYLREAIRSLDAAVHAGFVDEPSIRTDPDLAPLRGTTPFDALLTEISGK